MLLDDLPSIVPCSNKSHDDVERDVVDNSGTTSFGAGAPSARRELLLATKDAAMSSRSVNIRPYCDLAF